MSQNILSVTIQQSGMMEKIEAHAASRGESVEDFVLRAIKKTMYQDMHPHTLDGEMIDEEEEIQKYLKGRE